MTVEAAVAKSSRLFYGWIIALLGFLTHFISAGVSVYVFSVFFLPMAQEFGWTRTMISGVVTVRSILGALSGPLIGRAADSKHGARILMTLGGLLGGASLVLLGSIHTLWQFYLVFAVGWGVAMMMAGELIVGTMLAKWFIRKRGRAVAFSAIGISMGGVVLIPLSQFVIDAYGWRTAWVVLGILVWILIVPLSALFMRRSPEDVGLLPDGLSRDNPLLAASQGVRPQGAYERSMTARQAVTSRLFWIILAAVSIASLPMSGFLIHYVPVIQDAGFSAREASTFYTIHALVAALAKLAWGFLAERLSIRVCMCVTYLGSCLGMVALILAHRFPHSVFLVALFVAFFAGSAGGYAILNVLLWANTFGRQFLGTIRGIAQPMSVAVSSLSPLVAGVLYDVYGSYDLALGIFAVAFIISGVVVFFGLAPQKAARHPKSVEA